jgi:Na+/H+-dicarboxylate symporter
LVGFGLFVVPVMAVGLALAIVAVKDARKEHRSGRVMAIGGIVLSALALVLTVAWIGFLVNGLVDSGEMP